MIFNFMCSRIHAISIDHPHDSILTVTRAATLSHFATHISHFATHIYTVAVVSVFHCRSVVCACSARVPFWFILYNKRNHFRQNERLLPWCKKLVTLLCKPSRGPELALGPLGAPEYESRLDSRSRVPLSTFSCRFYQLRWWSPAEVHWTVHVDCPRGQIQTF